MKNLQLKPFIFASVIALVTYVVNILVVKTVDSGGQINYIFSQHAFQKFFDAVITFNYQWIQVDSILTLTLQVGAMVLGGFLCARKAKGESSKLRVRMVSFGVIVGYTSITMLMNTYDFSHWIISNEWTSHRSSVRVITHGLSSIAIQNATHFTLMGVVAGLITLFTQGGKQDKEELTAA